MKQALLISFLIGIATGLTACGNNSTGEQGSDGETFLRVFNATPDIRGADVFVNDALYFENMGYLDSSGYFRVNSRGDRIQVTVTRSFTPLYDRLGGLDDTADNSLFTYGPAEDERAILLRDENGTPGEDLSKMRIINLSRSNRRGIDVYVTSTDTRTLPSAPTAETLGSGGVSEYVVGQSGEYKIQVTSTNSNEIIASLPKVTFESEGVYSILVVDTAPGKLPLRVLTLRDSR